MKTKLIYISLYLIITFIISILTLPSCKKSKDTTLPNVSTNNVTNITETTAEIVGNIVDVGSENILNYGHCWSTTPSPSVDLTTKTQFGATNNTKTFNSILTNLLSNTKYYVRAYATTSTSTVYSSEVVFTTSLEFGI